MSRPTRNKSDAPGKKGSPLLTGILLGMVFGVALAAGLAWYLLKSPSPFVNKEQAVRPAAEAAKPAALPKVEPIAPPATTDAEEAKPRFEFYKVLTDKQDATAAPGVADKPKVTESSTATALPATYLQAGSFATAEAAESLKARLAMNGVESTIQAVKSADGVLWHRVRVGPFQSEKELNKMRGTLKLNGVEATLTR
ncbi:MAG: SPOR domain-containing protein [Thiomonas sp.]|nr:SPOR domain-containing protein [Thiomonas sp.]